ncbi:MAG: hypothetical protein IPJ68_00330 [Candidatus Moraniibacteriota bacterium]|nr:MAG: hypothetical protein IPJ68_00330 [Candidatus Moranbacteria bacterium]
MTETFPEQLRTLNQAVNFLNRAGNTATLSEVRTIMYLNLFGVQGLDHLQVLFERRDWRSLSTQLTATAHQRSRRLKNRAAEYTSQDHPAFHQDVRLVIVMKGLARNIGRWIPQTYPSD